jgi:hypothetical protein
MATIVIYNCIASIVQTTSENLLENDGQMFGPNVIRPNVNWPIGFRPTDVGPEHVMSSLIDLK